MKLTQTSYVVLGLIERCGTSYALKKKVEDSIGYFWSFPHTQLYTEPKRLLEGGYLRAEEEEGGRRRRTFHLTPKGEQALSDWLSNPTAESVELRDPGLLQLFFSEFGDQERLMALAQTRLEMHQKQLGYYEEIGKAYPSPEWDQRFAVVEMGIRYEQSMVDFWKQIIASPPNLQRGEVEENKNG